MIKQLLTLGLVTAGVTWLAKSRNMISGHSEVDESMETRKRMGSDNTSRNMRSGSMKSDTVGARDTTYSPSHSAPRSGDSGGVYNNPTATGAAARTSTSSASPGTYGPGSTSTKQ